MTRSINSALTCKYWYILDGRGNVVALTDTTCIVVDRYSYDVWGVPTIALATVKQPLPYAGYWYDRELQAPNETTGVVLAQPAILRPGAQVNSHAGTRQPDPCEHGWATQLRLVGR